MTQPQAEIGRLYERQCRTELNHHLDKEAAADGRDERIESRANDKFMALPNFYPSRGTGEKKFTNMDDAIGSLSQPELISIARALRDGDHTLAGQVMAAALKRICLKEAEYEIDEEDEKK